MKKNKLLFIGIIIIIVLLMGSTIGFNGLFFFTTDYYKTPQEAVLNNLGSFANIEIEKSIDVIDIADNTCLYVATTKNDELFVGELYVKNDKFSFLRNYTLYNTEDDDYSEDSGLTYNYAKTYDSKGLKKNNFKYAVLFEKLSEDFFEKDMIFNYYNNTPYDELMVVHKIETY